MQRQAAVTDPFTYTAGEVASIFQGATPHSLLIKLDNKGIIRPSHYAVLGAPGALMTPAQRDALIAKGRTPRDPERRYTYSDLVWIRFFVQVKEKLTARHVRKASEKAAHVIARIKDRRGDTCPPATRVVILGQDAYLLDGDKAECLTRPKQLALAHVLTDEMEADVRGRVSVLEAHNKVRRNPVELDEEGGTAAGKQG